MKFARTQPRTKQLTHLTPSFYGIPNSFHTLRLIDFYPNLSFITNQDLNTMTNTTIIPLDYKNFEKHIKRNVGLNKTYDSIVKKTPQRKHTKNNTHDFTIAIKSSSNKFRKIIARRHTNRLNPLQPPNLQRERRKTPNKHNLGHCPSSNHHIQLCWQIPHLCKHQQIDHLHPNRYYQTATQKQSKKSAQLSAK